MNRRLYVAALISLALAACAGAAVSSHPWIPEVQADGWTAAGGSTRQVGLGWPGGAKLAEGVRFAGGVQLIAAPVSSLHGLSDLTLTGDGGFLAVSDAGDLVRGRLALDGAGRLTGLDELRVRRLTAADGAPIADKTEGDAEGLALTDDGELLVSFERDHRIWSYGPLEAMRARPEARPHPAADFPANEGMEALALAPGGWRVGGEGGGVWDCSPAGCRVVVEATAPADSWRLTGLTSDPGGDGWFAVQRSWRPPFDVRARVRRMDADGALGPVLIELKLPGLTDNFEGVAAEARGEGQDGGVRLYILSDDNANPAQKTLMLAFDVR